MLLCMAMSGFRLVIVGRPNVGKSALFNRIVKKRLSIIEDVEGVTRDVLYGKADIFGKEVSLIDTGGIAAKDSLLFSEEIKEQTLQALQIADMVIFVVDGAAGITIQDEEVAKILLHQKKPTFLAINKTDNEERQWEHTDFYSLGFSEVFSVSALHGRGVADLLEAIEKKIPTQEEQVESSLPKVAIVGCPNRGKSTLINALTNTNRSLVSKIPGTTRDAVDSEVDGMLFIDTAGLQKKKSDKTSVDKFASIRTWDAIERADIVVLLMDAQKGFTRQEKMYFTQISRMGKGCILLLNKWDLVKDFRKEHAMLALYEKEPFIRHVPILIGSLLHKKDPLVQELLDTCKEVYQTLSTRITTGQLNSFLQRAIQKNHPPAMSGKRLRIYYLTQHQTMPPKFCLFINQKKLFSDTYKQYLINQMRKQFGFKGAPLHLVLQEKKSSKSPPKKAIY